MTEYVRITFPEKVYGEKNLLYAEMEILTTTKRLIEYRELRKKEHDLKIKLKMRMQELMSLLDSADKMLPKVRVEEARKTEKKTEIQETIEDSSLDMELEKIKSKIASLQGYKMIP